jgi:hypothetical protein
MPAAGDDDPDPAALPPATPFYGLFPRLARAAEAADRRDRAEPADDGPPSGGAHLARLD